MFLMMIRVFDGLGYRRYEWKCDVLNKRSIKAAERLGFKFEGIFRQATMYKNRNRDTAWFSIIDKDWPQLKESIQLWLNPENFDQEGQQKLSLTEIRYNH
jgi:RimJ/RimL family protein N-acetyltransferase